MTALNAIRLKIGKLALAAVALLGTIAGAQPALAVSCSSQSQIPQADRDALVKAAKGIAALVQGGDIPGLKAVTLASVAERFDPIAAAVESAAPLIGRATITVDSLFLLDSTDLKETQDETQFFCGGANAHEVVLTIPNIPPGKYALTALRASGVDSPQSITFLLSADTAHGGQWKLAGSYIHPLTSAGHDGIWYWNQARQFATKKQNWNAYFYYQTAGSLLTPVYFLSSPNLDKLLKEQAAIAPSNLPSGPQSMAVTGSGGQSFEVTDMHTDSSLGGLDLVMQYKGQNISDPVATRTRNVELMKAIVKQHAELREAFHGLWVFATAPNEAPFATELVMGQIQ